MATVVYDDPTNPKSVPLVQGSIREDMVIPAYVAPLDVDLLTSKPILPPIDYTNLDFSSIKLQLLNLMKANSKAFGYSPRDFSDANTAGMMLNLTAYMGQMISYHADSMVNELFLDTSQSSWSTFRLLNMYGYKPTRPQPGMILLAIIRRPSTNFNTDVKNIEDNSEIMFSNSLGRKRFTFGTESYEIFPAKENNGTLIPDLLADFVIPPYVNVDNPDSPDTEVEAIQKNLYLCFGLTGKTIVEDFISNGNANQVITLGSGPVNNSKVIVQVEDFTVPKVTGKTVYKIWDELTYLSLAGFRTATRVGTSLDGKTPYLAASFKLSANALKLKQQNRLKVGTLMSVDYNNTLDVANFQAYKDLLVPFNTCIIINLNSEKYNTEDYVDVLLYHPSYVYGDSPNNLPIYGTQATLVNYVYNGNAKVYWETGDILYLLNNTFIGNRIINGILTPVYQPQIISDTQIDLADLSLYPDIAYLKMHPEEKIAIGKAISANTLAFGISADYDTYIESDEIYEVTTDGDFFAKVRFGDGVFGKIPEKNAAIKVIYRVSDAETTGNIVRTGEANQTVTIGSVDLLIRNDYDSSPAISGEDPAVAKELVTRFFSSQDRAVTGTDYTILVKKFNYNYKVATTLSKADADGSVVRIYTLARRFGNSLEKLEPLSLVEKLQLREYLNAYKCLGVSLEIVDGLLRPLDVRIDVRIKPGYLAGQVKSDVQSVAASFFDFKKLEMGLGFKATEFIKTVSSVSGIETCDFYFGGLETVDLGDGSTVILGNKVYQQIKDIPSYTDTSATFPALGNTITGMASVTKQLKPYEILVLDNLIINTVSR
jgi:hypothetical protein